jgi:hypothetical protein
VPLGYDLKDGALVVNEDDAVVVRNIFSHYLELGSGPKLIAELRRAGVTSKARQCKDGRVYGATRSAAVGCTRSCRTVHISERPPTRGTPIGAST